nr:peptidase S1 [Hyphomonas sp. Mor2]
MKQIGFGTKILVYPMLCYLSLALPSTAQYLLPDYRSAPEHGSHRLEPGFIPDPYSVNVVIGGEVSARTSIGGPSCRGFISVEPDIKLHWNASEPKPLTIKVDSDHDTTLVIKDPWSNWLCDDDSGLFLNAKIALTDAKPGRYDVWVGSISKESRGSAVVQISEIDY